MYAMIFHVFGRIMVFYSQKEEMGKKILIQDN